MKRCPECRRDYYDDTLLYCLEDGNALVQGAVSPPDEPATAILHSSSATGQAPTRAQINTTDATVILPSGAGAQGSLGGLSEKHNFSAHRAAKPLIALLAAVILLVGGFFGYRYFSVPSSKQINSIAVMPFENRNSDADTDYLSDGLAESLIFRLTQIPDLRVSPTSSVMRYKGASTDIAKIAAELGVDAVMTGRLTKRGDDLNITVELVDARSNKSLWGEQYQRKMTELLNTQREIAGTIVQKLQFKLAGGDKIITKKYTENNDAYQLYLKARYHFGRRTKEDIYKSIDVYNEAIKLDPNFALAYAGIAEVYAAMPSYPYASPAECTPMSKAAVAKALELDPDLAEAHANAGSVASTYEWDWAKGESELKRGIELGPDTAVTHFRYAQYLSLSGRHDQAVAEMRKTMELEPMSAIQGANYAGTLMWARRYDEALDQARKAHDLDPSMSATRFWLGRIYNIKGMYSDCLALGGEAPSDVFNMGLAYAKLGQRDKALEIIRRFHEDEKQKYVMSTWTATIYAALGDKDGAFAELEKAFQNRDFYASRIYVDSFLDPLRDDPRFDALVRRLNLPK